jgi:hypothetical protein
MHDCAPPLAENASYRLDLVTETARLWILGASAVHMPRKMGSFLRGRLAQPCPLPRRFSGDRDNLDQGRILAQAADNSIQPWEWIGIAAYRVIGQMGSLCDLHTIECNIRLRHDYRQSRPRGGTLTIVKMSALSDQDRQLGFFVGRVYLQPQQQAPETPTGQCLSKNTNQAAHREQMHQCVRLSVICLYVSDRK